MKTFQNFILEKIINVFSSEEKQPFLEEVWTLIQKSYAPIGGTKGFGFDSKESFIKLIPFWKLLRKNGKVVAAVVYRDRGGRKLVAVASDGSPEGRQGIIQIFKEELSTKRSFFEISGPLLKFLFNNLGEFFLKDNAISFNEVSEILRSDTIFEVEKDSPELKMFPSLSKFFYQREIGGHLHTKILLGRPGNHIIFK